MVTEQLKVILEDQMPKFDCPIKMMDRQYAINQAVKKIMKLLEPVYQTKPDGPIEFKSGNGMAANANGHE